MKDLSKCDCCGGKKEFFLLKYYKQPVHYLGWLERHGKCVGFMRMNGTIQWMDELEVNK